VLPCELLNRVDLPVFSENPFPYELPEGTRHGVLWYGAKEGTYSDARVNQDIEEALKGDLTSNPEPNPLTAYNPDPDLGPIPR